MGAHAKVAQRAWAKTTTDLSESFCMLPSVSVCVELIEVDPLLSELNIFFRELWKQSGHRSCEPLRVLSGEGQPQKLYTALEPADYISVESQSVQNISYTWTWMSCSVENVRIAVFNIVGMIVYPFHYTQALHSHLSQTQTYPKQNQGRHYLQQCQTETPMTTAALLADAS